MGGNHQKHQPIVHVKFVDPVKRPSVYVFNEVMSLKLNVIIVLPLSNENTFTSHKKWRRPCCPNLLVAL